MSPEPEDFSHQWRDATEMEPELSEREREIRNRFVEEYLFDRNSYAACLRIGYMSAFALEYSKRFMAESYVQKLIKEKTNIGKSASADSKEERLSLVLASLHREAHYYGPGSSHASRVAALTNLAKMYGVETMDAEAADEGGVMLVPSHESIDDWEKNATESQEALQQDVRS